MKTNRKDQTRFMLHEVQMQLDGVSMWNVIEAVKTLGLRGRMIAGTRYWTSEEVQKIEAYLANSHD